MRRIDWFLIGVTCAAVTVMVGLAYVVGYSAGEQDARQRYETRIEWSW